MDKLIVAATAIAFLFLLPFLMWMIGGTFVYIVYNFIAASFGWPILEYWVCVAVVALISFLSGFLRYR